MVACGISLNEINSNETIRLLLIQTITKLQDRKIDERRKDENNCVFILDNIPMDIYCKTIILYVVMCHCFLFHIPDKHKALKAQSHVTCTTYLHIYIIIHYESM